MINKIVESLDQKPNKIKTIIDSLAYTITFITIFLLSNLLVNFYVIDISRTIYLKFFAENYIWLGIALFIAMLLLNVFLDYRNRNDERSRSSLSKCLTLICYFMSSNVVFLAATDFIVDHFNLYASFLTWIFFIPFLIFSLWSAYILIKSLKEIIKSSKAFDVFLAVITSSLDALVFVGILFLFWLQLLFIFDVNFYLLDKYIESNLNWYVGVFFIVRLSWKIYKIYEKRK